MVFRIFKREFDANQFERELNVLTDRIHGTESTIERLQRKQKAVKWWVYTRSFVLYIMTFIYCYSRIPGGVQARNSIQWFIRGQTSGRLKVLAVAPLVIVALVKLVDLLFHVVVDNQRRSLRAMRNKHRQKIDELKKITNFNTTNELLSKYGNADGAGDKAGDKAGIHNGFNPSSPNPTINSPNSHPSSHPNSPNPGHSRNPSAHGSDSPASPLFPPSPNPDLMDLNLAFEPSETPKRTIQDRLLDLLIGSDNSETVENRYALICGRCFTHNGLAPPRCRDPSLVRYLCFRCGALNGRDQISTDVIKEKDQGNEVEKEEKTSENHEKINEEFTEKDEKEKSIKENEENEIKQKQDRATE